MVFFSARKSTSIFGARTEEKQMSMTAKFHSRKYMGVWSLESEVTVNMVRWFPMTAVVQTNRTPETGRAGAPESVRAPG